MSLLTCCFALPSHVSAPLCFAHMVAWLFCPKTTVLLAVCASSALLHHYPVSVLSVIPLALLPALLLCNVLLKQSCRNCP
jgi:hypothetical protein